MTVTPQDTQKLIILKITGKFSTLAPSGKHQENYSVWFTGILSF